MVARNESGSSAWADILDEAWLVRSLEGLRISAALMTDHLEQLSTSKLPAGRVERLALSHQIAAMGRRFVALGEAAVALVESGPAQ